MVSGPAPRRLTRAEAKQQTRERLVAAATEVAARRGFAGATVDEIAETAGYTVGALYSQFGSKDKLILEAMHHHIAQRVTEAGAIMDAGSIDDEDNRVALGKLLAGSVDDNLVFGPLFWAELWLHAARNPELADLVASEARVVDEVIERGIHARRASAEAAGVDTLPAAGEGPEEITDEALATVISSLYRGLAQRRRIDPDAVPDDLVGQALRLLVAGRRALRPG